MILKSLWFSSNSRTSNVIRFCILRYSAARFLDFTFLFLSFENPRISALIPSLGGKRSGEGL
jgi:hypothetical protein